MTTSNASSPISRTLLASVLLAAGFLTASCSQTVHAPPPIVVTKVVPQYPQLPDVPPVPKPKLTPWKYDFPRRTKDQPLIKNTAECKAVPEAKHDVDFWTKCGEFPVDSDSNIFIGFDQKNWTTFINDWAEVQAYTKALEARLAEVNRQRAEWRKRNKTKS